MMRREFIMLLGGAAAWPLAARAQQRTILPQVGILDPGIPQHFEAFRRGMRDLGYVEGNSISYIYRTAAGRAEPVSRFASELVALKPDVIVTASAVPIRALKEATSTIPIVFVLADAITTGLVNNLAHPGENLTGLSFLNTELSAKRLELLLEMLPNIRRIAVLRDLNTPRIWAEATEETGRRLTQAATLRPASPPRPPHCLQAGSRSRGLPLPFRPLPRLAQNEERECAGCEARRGGRMGQKETAVSGKNRIMIFGPKTDGTYVVEFRTAAGEALAISIPGNEAGVIRHFQERMPYGLFVPDE
jgi:hypothetical protein